MGSRPNLLLVFADQMLAGMTGAEGHPQAITPALDRLVGEGVLLDRCISNVPVCCPMRGSMWTGVWPTRHGVVSNDLPVRTDLPTLGTSLRQAGYRTGYVGKWHLDGVPRRKFTPPGKRRLGFDDFWAAFNCAHDYFNPRYFRDTPALQTVPGYEPTVQTDLALRFLQSRDDRPFALVVSYGPPHDPYAQVPQPYRDLYDPATITLSGNVRHPIDNPLARGLDCRQVHADYLAAVTALDAELARLLDALTASNASEHTHVVFTSDHGDMLWSHGWMKKQSPYDESVRVPMIARGPGIAAGSRTGELVSLVDLMPTLPGLLDLPIPDQLHGRDCSDVLRRRSEGRDAVLIGNLHSCDEAAMQGMPEWRGLRTRAHTYVERRPGVPWLLFDDRADPLQQTNLSDDPRHASLRASLSARLAKELADHDDPFVPGEALMARMGLSEAWQHRDAHLND
ncbi:MAG TPA: sulfatase-like hydrolase/transferase [Tepidisphaeraceae bacterium]|nr:sulfatase-like hydrolase/transferase [Tepidisphaeraceae bacterium]